MISVEQVISSVSLRRLKLYNKLGLEDVVDADRRECCKGTFGDRDEDLELVDDCFENASELSEDEKAALYHISGYVTYKEII